MQPPLVDSNPGMPDLEWPAGTTRPGVSAKGYNLPAERWWRRLAPLTVVGGGTAGLFAYLLRRFPYDGLYGQDAFAYYYQARAFLDEALGRAPQAGALYSTSGLQHWPIGYHLQIIAGFALGGEGVAGPRLLTIAMAALCPLLVYALLGLFLPEEYWAGRFIAGAIAGFILPLNATYTRMGLSLMSDVPSLFWTLLGVYCLLRAVPPMDGETLRKGNPVMWAAGAGFATGLAMLTRYGTAAIFAPLIAYLGVTWLYRSGHRKPTGESLKRTIAALAAGLAAFLTALSPQGIYLTGHNPGQGVSGFLSGMSLSNLINSTSVSPDGTATYAQPMAVFYLVDPFWDTASGFLSLFFLPVVCLGLCYLAWRRAWNLLSLLVTWWLLPGLIYATTPYQAQRFTLLYLPAIAIAVGLGIYCFAHALRRPLARGSWTGWGKTIASVVLGVFLLLGTLQCLQSVRNWVATHAAWQAQDQRVVSLAQKAAEALPHEPGLPHVISFGATAALYHYTSWPTLELYNSDERAIQDFVSRTSSEPGPNLVVVPVHNLDTQWAGTPLARRWSWLQSNYQLTAEGSAGEYTVFRLATVQR